jgi:putative membrane protein
MYEWIKIAHIISVISWMVGLLYLPRLMVYHSAAKLGSDVSETFKTMERRLLKGIMTPAMISSWVFGLILAYMSEFWLENWFLFKLIFVVLLTVYHLVAVGWVGKFARDQNSHNQRFFRFANEVPTVIMIFVVVLVIIKPF